MAYSTSTIAAGCFGKIYREKYNDTWAAIKKVPQHLINRKDLERECQVYNKAVHPNIVKLLGNPTLKDSKWIIPMEFIFGEELETTIFTSSKSKIQLSPPIKATIITGMCEGLLHLHSKDIVHQDLKPDNIMVEHETHRAVIIDMGLAKFFRNGLNSAINMGNEAYSPPEVLQRTSQRDQRSDVWAMGKIIAELCARVRLHTPSVCPEKIQQTLSHQGQKYCNAVCRMVQSNPRLRATMAEVIPEIRRANDSGGNTREQQTENIQKPFPHNEVKDKLPRPQAPVQRTRRPEVKTIVRAPVRAPSPSRWERAAASPNPDVKITPSPEAPVQRSQSPLGFEHKTPPRPDVKTLVRAPVRAPSPSRWERAAASPNPDVKITPSPEAPVQRSQSPLGFEDKTPPRPDVKTLVRAPVRAPSPSRWERAAASPNPDVKITPSPEAPVQRSQSPLGFEHKTPPRPDVKTLVRAPVRAPSPSRWERAAASPNPDVKITPSPEAPVQRSQSPLGFEHKTPPRPDVKTLVRAPVRAPSPSRWECAALPKAEVKMQLLPQAPLQRSPSPSRFELAALPKPEVKKSPTPCAKVQQGKAVVQRSPAVMNQLLYQEASKGFPCPLPQTGNVRISRYMQTDGEVESWEQKEVETKGGRIVKYEDIKYNNKS
ncbi:serine/threonine-protein kinase svkA-like isoform X1 [Esox lucius]|uniref:Protein kinase domain-containing protein n=1 Tax=Esox lucius TaxID=8010 RepID=A0A6Q2ZMJ9_ESOLU|nr:serine/threonine-protein kinase svkA-like isoform X1 [Esox lucius]XP_028971339.1 serine/threonine-protein kinase svkA-like isoform X1 [Esox lucius]XP_028971340.1 serine/threonine-protein kinase svkA-like isoform X1 [Esox lucius]